MKRSTIFAFAVVCLIITGCADNRGETLLKRGLQELEAGDAQAASALLTRATAKLENSATAHCNLGLALLQLHKLDEAADAFGRAAQLSPEDSRPLELLAQVHIQAKEWSIAQQVLEGAQERAGTTPKILTTMAIVKINLDELYEARTILGKALSIQPDYAPALYNLAALYRDKAENPAKAVEYFEAFLEAGGDDEHRALASEYIALQRAPEPEPTEPNGEPSPVDTAPTPQPPVQTAATEKLLEKATAHIKEESYLEALLVLKEAVKLSPDSADVLWELALLYDKHLELDSKAKQTYALFKKRFPNDHRGDLLSSSKPAPLAPVPKPTPKPTPIVTAPIPPQTITPTAETSRRAAELAFQKARKHHRAGELDKAISQYRMAMAHDNNLALAAFNLGLLYKKRGDIDAAKDSFIRTVTIDPKMYAAHYMLGVIHVDRKEMEEAMKCAKKALAINPRYDRGHLLMGILHTKNDRPDMAKNHFEACIDNTSDPQLARQARKVLANITSQRSRVPMPPGDTP